MPYLAVSYVSGVRCPTLFVAASTLRRGDTSTEQRWAKGGYALAGELPGEPPRQGRSVMSLSPIATDRPTDVRAGAGEATSQHRKSFFKIKMLRGSRASPQLPPSLWPLSSQNKNLRGKILVTKRIY